MLFSRLIFSTSTANKLWYLEIYMDCAWRKEPENEVDFSSCTCYREIGLIINTVGRPIHLDLELTIAASTK